MIMVNLKKNKNKFYNNMGLKKLPKNDKHIKSKKSLGKNSIDEDEVFFFRMKLYRLLMELK